MLLLIYYCAIVLGWREDRRDKEKGQTRVWMRGFSSLFRGCGSHKRRGKHKISLKRENMEEKDVE